MKIHVLTIERGRGRLVFHIPIPAAINSAGFPYRDALVASGKGGTSQLTEGTGPGQITTAELTQIQAGEVLEVPHTIRVYSTSSGGLGAYLDSEWVRIQGITQAQLAEELEWYGLTRD